MPKLNWSMDLASLPLETLGTAIEAAETAEAKELFAEIGDAIFSDGFGVGSDIVAAIRRCSALPIHLHARVSDPTRVLDTLIELECDRVTLPVETLRHGHRALAQLRDHGIAAGVSVLPGTSLANVHYLTPLLDQVLLLSAEDNAPAGALPKAAFDRLRITRDHLRHRRSKARIFCRASTDPATLVSQRESGTTDFIVADPSWITGAPITETIARLIG